MNEPSVTPLSPFAGERFWRAIRDSVGRAVVVDDEAIRLLAIAVLAHGHALIEDVPGVGKTLLARAFSRALGMDFSRVQGTPGPPPERRPRREHARGWQLPLHPRPDLHQRPAGRRDQPRDAAHAVGPARGDGGGPGVDRGRDAGPARPVPRAGHREPDRARGHVRAAGGAARPFPRPDPARLPGSRRRGPHRAPLSGQRRAARRGDPGRSHPSSSSRCAKSVRTVDVSAPVEDYIVDLVRETRSAPRCVSAAARDRAWRCTARPRRSAYLAGRDFALPDDVKALVPAVLGHRIVLDIDRQLRGSTVDGVIDAVLGSVAAPPVQGVTAQNRA